MQTPQTPPFFPVRLQPRFIPTLTEVVQLPVELSAQHAAAPVGPAEIAEPDGLQAHLVQRVMLRVDVLLSQRMNEAVAEVVRSHLQQMAPLLHQAIESTVYDAVCEAMAQELTSQTC